MIDTSLLVGHDIYVYCETEEQAEELLTAMEGEGYRWLSGDRLTDDILWPSHDFAAYHLHPDGRVTRSLTETSYADFSSIGLFRRENAYYECVHINDVLRDDSPELDAADDEEFFSILGMGV